MSKQDRMSQLKQKKQQIEKEYETLLEKQAKTEQKLDRLTYEFDEAKKYQGLLKLVQPAHIKKMIRTTGAYILGRRNRKQLYSSTYKRKQASNDLKKYKYALYNEGFVEKTLSDLETIYEETKNRYEKRAIAYELALWHANKQTIEGAEQALPYLIVAKHGENNSELLRKMTIVEAECLTTLKQHDQAAELIQQQLQKSTHPDLYLALANTETDIKIRIERMNQVMKMYQLKPIDLCPADNSVLYDRLCTKQSEEKVSGPKISVILPAYNSEEGIHTAIQSILSQTWENIELIIVDDCSTDDTLAVAKSYEREDDRVRVLRTPTNSGPYIARNIALQAATGEFVTINDADDWSHAEKLHIQATHLLNNPDIIANTSEQARLTEDLHLYRRGTPGTYIFPNMSSIMFRREAVVERIGYWDNVRFAADGEYKRRILLAFGEEVFVDLKTGPLSFPRQTATSLTASSAFGYSGFFMGVRKEYVESFTYYHQHGENLKYPAKQEERLFPVPVPMLPERATISRTFDVIISADFYALTNKSTEMIITEIKKNQQLGLKTGLVQMSSYTLNNKKQFSKQIREVINGDDVQMVVYGEKVKSSILIIHDPSVLNEKQTYLPQIDTIAALVIIEESPNMSYNRKIGVNYHIRQAARNLLTYINKKGRWYPIDDHVRKELIKNHQRELKSITLAANNWTDEKELFEEKYALALKNWLV